MWIYLLNTPFVGTYQDAKELFGGKGAGLRQMHTLGIPVPAAFTITTALCNLFYKRKKTLPDEFHSELRSAIHALEENMGLQLGDRDKPLLLSVRSGARASMPGMMDTILNLGLNDQTVSALARNTGDGRFAYDSYRRFIQMYSNVVLNLSIQPFEEVLTHYKTVRNVSADSELAEEDLRAIVARYLEIVKNRTGEPFPQDVWVQLMQSIRAVLKSWMNKRAVTYRSLYSIPETWGTAVTVQAMVFGNLGQDSGTGVAFTRNPATGENAFFGEYLLRAQGEDVVAGIRTPEPLTKLQKTSSESVSLEDVMPDIYKQLLDVKSLLEKQYQDMQDIEFTIQNGKLWILQTRHGKRTAKAAIKIATDLVTDDLADRKLALMRVEPPALDQLLHPQLQSKENLVSLGQGLAASPGAAVGRAALSAEQCVKMVAEGYKVILVRDETSPEDIEGMALAEGILTARGGMTSHAAVVTRGMGKPCVVGTPNLFFHDGDQGFSLGGVQMHAKAKITLDGTTGEVFQGEAQLAPPTFSKDFFRFMTWADEVRTLSVRANADTAEDVKRAIEMGAEGVGLCRTEHMFFDSRRILAVREMILAPSRTARAVALAKIHPMQREDFAAIFRAAQGRPVNVRLLDPPLHEFLPTGEQEIDQIASALKISTAATRARIHDLGEVNPMLGNRGCRLGITFPEIYETQVRALFEATLDTGGDVDLEIMVPLVSITGELKQLSKMIQRQARLVREASGSELSFKVGTMIELPRAALKADKIAQYADFISFGTNDLTQTTFGFSRDDVSSFLPTYRRKGILERDPFESLDQSGVGELIRIAVEKARQVRPAIKLGVCGEQGGDPLSIEFFQKLGLNYISCSPYRVPVARLAAAQADLKMNV
jgi:pyruvate,orthophosphate dikinase